MKSNIKFFIVVFSIIFFSLFLVRSPVTSTNGQIPDNVVINPSSPTDVFMIEQSVYDAPIGNNRPIYHLYGLLYWEQLAGSGAKFSFFINTTNVISAKFWDHETKQPLTEKAGCATNPLVQGCIATLSDRYIVSPSGRSFQYQIDAYYSPDIVKDTGFIVIFNSQSVDFSLPVDGQAVYAKVDYQNTITLPQGAALVSAAPIHDEGYKGYVFNNQNRIVLSWEYRHRAMDSRHNPLMIEVTYKYDNIFLAFNKQVYRNQQIQSQRQEQLNRLNLLNSSFIIISSLAIVASLISMIAAYLLARRKFEPKLKQARELPRRSASDIEKNPSLQIPTKSLFLGILIFFPPIIAPLSMGPIATNHIATTPPNTIPIGSTLMIPSNYINQVSDQNIQWTGVIDLGYNKNNASTTNYLTEHVKIKLPVSLDQIFVAVNTTNTQMNAYDVSGNPLVVEKDVDRYIILNPGSQFSYDLKRPYTIYINPGQILVFLDRFWLEYYKPNAASTPSDPYFHVDMKYSILLPSGAFLYSASPTKNLLKISTTDTGRKNVTFTDTNRRMDAFHDVFETQVTFAFDSILNALQNLNSEFEQQKVVIQTTQNYIDVARKEILLFSLLGLIAPIISFIIAYWVLRRRYQKLIARIEQQQEENIFVEDTQINAFVNALNNVKNTNLAESFKGHYWRLMNILSDKIGKDLSILDEKSIRNEIDLFNFHGDKLLLMELIQQGYSLKEEDSVGYDQLFDYVKNIDLIIDQLNKNQKK